MKKMERRRKNKAHVLSIFRIISQLIQCISFFLYIPVGTVSDTDS